MNQKSLNPNNNPLLLALSTVVSGIFIASAVMVASGGWNFLYESIVSSLPKFPSYQSVLTVNDYSSIQNVFASQPKLSYNSNAKYLFVEVSDLDCINCANWQGYKQDTAPFKRFVSDYVEKGKIDYMFIDKQSLGGSIGLTKHASLYCIGEQSPQLFFSYKSLLYKNYGVDFSIDRAKNYVNQVKSGVQNFDEKKLTDCIDSKKYEERVTKLTSFASSSLKVEGTPTFILYKFETQEITKIDGSKSTDSTYTEVARVIGNQDYALKIKPELDKKVTN